ncbi:hypothetical protein DPMN_164610 [Dreissena polymorpha]|uniref:Uncharacterized protein n=1 Tax=Dreissena polymorpha TaxID=45954 RepID=A0A9D4EVF7_DREPO|nr:hypothetical protein DPMN_164610 [Dreissena polymorpha]
MFVSPILMYGLEIVLPNRGILYKLEMAQKRFIKQLFMLHINTPYVAIYLLSGLLPIGAMIHKSAIVTFNSVCLQKDDAVERRLALRKVSVKSAKSACWFKEVHKLFGKYDLRNPEEKLETPVEKPILKKKVKTAIYRHWQDLILTKALNTSKLRHLNLQHVAIGRPNPLLQIPARSSWDANRALVKLNLMTGTYDLQSTRARFNKTFG